jgi:hypothetical protein
MPKVFVNYKSADSREYASQLQRILAGRFGAEKVLMDVHAMAVGETVASRVAEAVSECELFFVVIGRKWLETEDPASTGEIEVALKTKGVRVIPVLVGDAEFPKEASLPTTISELHTRHALNLNASFQDGLDRYLKRFPRSAHRPAGSRRRPGGKSMLSEPPRFGRLSLAGAPSNSRTPYVCLLLGS